MATSIAGQVNEDLDLDDFLRVAYEHSESPEQFAKAAKEHPDVNYIDDGGQQAQLVQYVIHNQWYEYGMYDNTEDIWAELFPKSANAKQDFWSAMLEETA